MENNKYKKKVCHPCDNFNIKHKINTEYKVVKKYKI